MALKTPEELCCKSLKIVGDEEDSRAEVKGKSSDESTAIKEDRIGKLETQVACLHREVHSMKREREAAENAIRCAIFRGVSALGGRYKVLVPCPLKEKLLDDFSDGDTCSCTSCSSETSSECASTSGINAERMHSESMQQKSASHSDASNSNDVKTRKKGDAKCGGFQLG